MNRTENIKKLCIILLFGMGMIYVFAIPPLGGPDEAAHFIRAYSIADGQMVLKDHPRYLIEFAKQILEERGRGKISHILAEMDRSLNENGERIPNLVFNTSLYSPVPYALYSLIIKIVEVFNPTKAGLFISLYVCRIASLMIFCILLCIAFNLCPFISWPFFWLAVTPMALSLAGTVSTDSIVFGMSAVFLSVSAGTVSDRVYSFALLFSSIFLFLTKTPYLPLFLVPLCFALLMDDSMKKSCRLRSLAFVFFSAAGCVMAWMFVMKKYSIYENSVGIISNYGQINLDPAFQFAFIINHPLDFFSIMLKTVSMHGISLYHQFVGNLGMLDIPIPIWAALLWGGALFMAILVSDIPEDISKKKSSLIGLSCILSSILSSIAVFASGYMIWMPVGAETVNLQGRYFHAPAMAFLTGVIFLKAITFRNSKWVAVCFCLMFIILFVINISAVSCILSSEEAAVHSSFF